MNREEAYYHKLLLMNGIDDAFDSWLDSYLKTEDPLSDIVLNLSTCGSNTNQIISYLHNYCLEKPFDEKVVCDKLRSFLKEAYDKELYTLEELCALMYKLALAHGDPGDFEMAIWGDMFYLDYYFSLANDGLIDKEKIEQAALLYLNEGTPINYDNMWNFVKKPSILEKIKSWFNK